MAKPKRGVVAVDTDGSIKMYFESRADAERLCKVCHKDMGKALKDHNLHVRGYTWWYEDIYREGWFKYGEEHFRWELSTTHKRRGSGFIKGHTLGNGYHRMSEESKRRRSELSKALCEKRKERGDYETQGIRYRKPIRCLTDGMSFEAIKFAASHYNIPPNQISLAIRRNGSVRNLKFVYV